MEIMFEDLNYETQKKLLEEAGVGAPEEMGWDINPIAIIEFDDDDDNSEDESPLMTNMMTGKKTSRKMLMIIRRTSFL